MTGWRLPLRMAWRDARRSRARSVLVLVLIALPVLGVTTADVLIRTSDVDAVERLDRDLGAEGQALVHTRSGVAEVIQDPEADYVENVRRGPDSGLTPEGLAEALGGRPVVEIVRGTTRVETDRGAVDVAVLEGDPDDDLVRGLVDLTDGRLPRAAGEVVVNRALADKGYAVGERLRLTAADADAPEIVGIAEHREVRTDPAAAGAPGSLAVEDEPPGRTWLVGGAPVTWDDVVALNGLGASVTSRAVLEDPPPDSAVPEVARLSGSVDDTWIAVVALVVVMALIEVVLLAGPSFAVGARRQARSLALVVAAGGTPAQARRVVLASALVLGGLGAAGGVVLGVGLAAALLPLVQSLTDQWLGPFDLAWLDLVGIATFGLASAVLAALVPAHLASRQDVVAVLAGRRGDRAPSPRSPVVGAVLLGGGIVGAVLGSRPGGEVLIAASAVPAVLGMVLLVPVVLALLGRVAGRLPLSLRFAVRDAARHRTRTVPAVAAVAATVTGVVALGISTSSDAAQSRAMYEPSLPMGMGVLSVLDGDVETARAALGQELPGAELVDVRGVVASSPDGDVDADFSARPVGSWSFLRSSSGSALGSPVLVSDGDLPPGLLGLDDRERAAAQEALAEGRAVMFTDTGTVVDQVQLRLRTYDTSTGRRVGEPIRARFPARVIEVEEAWTQPLGVLPTAVAEQAGLAVATVAVAVPDATITEAQQDAVAEVLTATSDGEGLYVERGPRTDDEAIILQLVLAGVGALLMLGGTLTATFLALADARPDLATLAAVGAAPRTRRGVAAAYALVVGSVGAVLGAAVGFVPGLAVTRPLTSGQGECVAVGDGPMSCEGGSGPFVDVPWLMILAIVVALPLLTALVVALLSRSRLPMVARLS